jgi:uncharacterized protein (TIRG00374 family)
MARGLGWKSASALAVIIAGWWAATHGVAGVTWRDVAVVLGAVPVSRLIEMTVVWIGGLALYATVLSAALPGLGARRGLLLNLSGSAVANLMPFGGAVATGMNWRMVRGWGHSDSAFLSFCVLTNVLDVLTKLLLPLVAVGGLLAMSVHVPTILWGVVAASGTIALLVLLMPSLVMRPPTGPTRPTADGARKPSLAWRLRSRLHDPVSRIRVLLHQHWPRLLPGSVAYVVAQVLLLLLSLRSVGLAPSLSVVLMAAAVERLGSLIPVTPAGTGIAEIGTVAWLVANRLDPVGVVAGVLLYRVFLVALEIPVGGLLLGGWAWLERRRVPAPSAPETA